ncbi:MAG: hypothetical protein EU542_04770 [Promethearchaeota archaeon]|nr:MAG: hypothetical protein EU542_04770 [Candidatus Lokiarchaeota archaeon]
MDDIKSNLSTDKFYKVLHSVDIEVEQGDIYYRKKYNDIINYFKMILTHNENSLLSEYSKIIIPKGLLLVKISPNSDIHEFLKLVCKNYFLDFFEMNYEKIFFNYMDFLEIFPEIILDIIKLKKDNSNTRVNNEDSLDKDLNVSINKILLIDENKLKFSSNDPTNLLERFINSKLNKVNYLENNSILIWITKKIKTISKNSQKIFDLFDLFININPLDRSEREAVLKHYSEMFPRIVFDLETIANYTNLWEVNDFKNLLKLGIFNHYLKSELNQKSNEITEVLIDLIETREFLPSINNIQEKKDQILEHDFSHMSNKGNLKGIDFRVYEKVKEYQNEIQEVSFSEFMRDQLYEHAASKHYKELQIILEKISKHENLEKNDRYILAKYPFVLNENPNKALITLEKAKKKIDRIKQMYKGT